jgi:hypothetical protein
MNKRIEELAEQAVEEMDQEAFSEDMYIPEEWIQKFAELIVADMHRKVIASILITDVVMEEKGQKPTSEDYIRAINKDFGVEE